jgi:general secretion pathway protein E/type IV pilus assembly protein PilB
VSTVGDTIAAPRPAQPAPSAEWARLAAEIVGPVVDLATERPAVDVLAALPRDFVRARKVIPFARRGQVLRVAMENPLDLETVDAASRLAGGQVEAAASPAPEIAAALDRYYPAGGGTGSNSPGQGDLVVAATGEDDEDTSSAPVVARVNDLIAAAIARRASDIHVEPRADGLRVRYRIDGVMIDADPIERRLRGPVVSRLKIMANISIAERRIPQDGRIQVKLASRRVDLRVSSLPTIHGESVVLRVLDRESVSLHPDALGLAGDDRERLQRILALPDGMVLVTGPTGSGKTTTLYACLNALNQVDRKIITVEEPVEFQLPGINQVPVRPEIGMTFASALRAMLRQSPNVILVGEIRDRETAEVAVNAALTGHLVFSTLHTNDAPGAVTRLGDLGARPFLVSAVLRAVVAQRLVRRICRRCRRPAAPTDGEMVAAGWIRGAVDLGQCARGSGCADCQGTGFAGRTAIFEMFFITGAVRQLIGANAGASALRAQARQDGMRSLRADGLRKVLAGETTIEEVLGATAGESP